MSDPELDEPVHLCEADEQWAKLAEVELERVCLALGVKAVACEHIGSTSVPGLVAKPVIDLMVGLEALPPNENQIAAMAELGYVSLGEAGVPGRWYFRLRAGRAFNVHVVKFGAAHWQANLALRSYLRSSADARAVYVRAKHEALAIGQGRLLAYSAAKSAAVSKLLAQAGSAEHGA